MGDWNRRIAGAAAVAQFERIKQLKAENAELLDALKSAAALMNAAQHGYGLKCDSTLAKARAAIVNADPTWKEGGESDD